MRPQRRRRKTPGNGGFSSCVDSQIAEAARSLARHPRRFPEPKRLETIKDIAAGSYHMREKESFSPQICDRKRMRTRCESNSWSNSSPCASRGPAVARLLSEAAWEWVRGSKGPSLQSGEEPPAQPPAHSQAGERATITDTRSGRAARRTSSKTSFPGCATGNRTHEFHELARTDERRNRGHRETRPRRKPVEGFSFKAELPAEVRSRLSLPDNS